MWSSQGKTVNHFCALVAISCCRGLSSSIGAKSSRGIGAAKGALIFSLQRDAYSVQGVKPHVAQPETLRDRVISRSGTPMAEAKAVCFVMAAFVLLAPLMLAAQVPAPGASKADSTLPQAPTVAETNESAELAQKLTNPLAKLISIPIQNWFDFNLGPKKDGFRYTMEAQPVYPVQISKNWNLLSRTTIPIVGTLASYFYKYKKINWL